MCWKPWRYSWSYAVIVICLRLNLKKNFNATTMKVLQIHSRWTYKPLPQKLNCTHALQLAFRRQLFVRSSTDKHYSSIVQRICINTRAWWVFRLVLSWHNTLQRQLLICLCLILPLLSVNLFLIFVILSEFGAASITSLLLLLLPPLLILDLTIAITFLNLSAYQLNHLQNILNATAHAFKRTPKILSHLSSLISLYWLKITGRIQFRIFSCTYQVLQTNQPVYLHNILNVQPVLCTGSSSLHSGFLTSLSDHSFSYYAPILWNSLPNNFVS
jgi:hypothetical protein